MSLTPIPHAPHRGSLPGSPARAGRPGSGALERLLRDLGSQIRPGGSPPEPPGRLPTGLSRIDRLLGGGFPRGRLSEIVGSPGSGRTGLALSLLSRATRSGEPVAVVDAADTFDPCSAEAAGVDLARVLWVRAPELRLALHSTERLLDARGFALVLLDLPVPGTPSAAWMRLTREAQATGTALVLLAPSRRAGPFAELCLETQPIRSLFLESPAWLEGLEARVRLARHRAQPPGGEAPLQLTHRAGEAAA